RLSAAGARRRGTGAATAGQSTEAVAVLARRLWRSVVGLEDSAHPTRLSRTLPYLVELLTDPLPMRSLPENPPAALALIEMIQPIKGPRWHLSSNVFFRYFHKHPAARHAPRLKDV